MSGVLCLVVRRRCQLPTLLGGLIGLLSHSQSEERVDLAYAKLTAAETASPASYQAHDCPAVGLTCTVL